jgi:hypothetical protein
MTDLPQSELITVGGTAVINTRPATSADNLADQYGFRPGQIVQNAAGTDFYEVAVLLRDAWWQAMWRARQMSRDEIDLWLAGESR